VATRTKSWFSDFVYNISRQKYWPCHGSGGLSPAVTRNGPGSVNAGFAVDRTTHGLLFRPVSFHECSRRFCSFMYYRAVSVLWITNYQWFCYPTLHILLFLFEDADIILGIHTHTHTDPSTPNKTPSGQTGFRKTVMWIIINETRISATPS